MLLKTKEDDCEKNQKQYDRSHYVIENKGPRLQNEAKTNRRSAHLSRQVRESDTKWATLLPQIQLTSPTRESCGADFLLCGLGVLCAFA